MSGSIDSFFAAWSIADADARLNAIRRAVSDTASYADPRTSDPLSGPAAISDYVGAFVESAPGAKVSVVNSGETDGMIRATVEFRMSDDMAQLGQYFVESDADKITRMVGFVGTGTPE